MTKPKNPEDLLPVGRPTLYKPEYAESVYKLALLGATDVEIADALEITEPTLNAWKKDHPEFFKSLKDGKLIANSEVACALYNRALGITVEDTRDVMHPITGEITNLVKTTKIPGDVKAMEVFLRNRDPKRWNVQKDLHITGDLFGSILDDAEVIDASFEDITGE